MPLRSSVSTASTQPSIGERRAELREPVIGCLWMIDNHSSTILRCRCIDVSTSGMRLRVPLGYGVREGQHYELTSHLPGQSSPPGLGLMVSRRAEVVRTQIVAADDEYDVEVGVALAPSRRTVVGIGDPITGMA
ncbi:MAG: PilZ domain-containing protein [Phycisphaerae bacterium]